MRSVLFGKGQRKFVTLEDDVLKSRSIVVLIGTNSFKSHLLQFVRSSVAALFLCKKGIKCN